MSEISSGLVAVRIDTDGYPLVRLSDAEAKLSECVTSYEKEVAGLTAELNAKDEEIERLERESSACDLVEEQKGTITALNMALGGEDSTSTENLIDAYEVDYNEEGLISLCRKLIAENVRLSDVIESTAINDTIEALGFANREIERLTTSENDWITCHAKIWRELQETKTIVGNQAERISDLEASPISEEVIDILRSKIKALESEILEQCRINGMGAERELALRVQMERQDERIKGLEEQAQSLARSVMCDQVSNDSHSLFLAAIRDLAAINECLGLDPDDGGAVPIIDAIEAQSAALKLAREALFDMQDSYAAVHGWKDSFVIAATTAIAAIDSLQKGD